MYCSTLWKNKVMQSWCNAEFQKTGTLTSIFQIYIRATNSLTDQNRCLRGLQMKLHLKSFRCTRIRDGFQEMRGAFVWMPRPSPVWSLKLHSVRTNQQLHLGRETHVSAEHSSPLKTSGPLGWKIFSAQFIDLQITILVKIIIVVFIIWLL